MFFEAEPFAIRVGVHLIAATPPKSNGHPLIITDASYIGTKSPVVSARAPRFELQVMKHAPRVILLKKSDPQWFHGGGAMSHEVLSQKGLSV